MTSELCGVRAGTGGGMNYIEKMMKTAGVASQSIYSAWTYEQIGSYSSDFTAEKQLEIIKLISVIRGIQIYTIPYENKGNKYFVGVIDKNAHFICVNRDFAQALAQLTTELMKAGELDKEKVKEVLES